MGYLVNNRNLFWRGSGKSEIMVVRVVFGESSLCFTAESLLLGYDLAKEQGQENIL